MMKPLHCGILNSRSLWCALLQRASLLILVLLGSIAGGPTGQAGSVATTTTTVSIADTSAIEPAADGTVDMVFTVTRTGDLASAITVGYTTVAATAQAGTDFTPTTGTVTFASGASAATISIPIFGNGVYDQPSVSFKVQLTGITDVVGPPVTLAARRDFAAGSNPQSVALGDFNGDGRPDLAIANNSSNDVSVLLNTTAPGAATPTFATKQTFATGVGPFSVAIGDLNGDGRPDLAVANSSSNTVSVRLNTTAPGAAMPTFATQRTFATGSSPFSVTIGDLNGDGRADLAVANISSDTVSVLLNTALPGAPIPTFAVQQTFATGLGPRFVTIGDLNGDGRPDLAVANQESSTASVLLNTTTPGATIPSFSTHQTFATGTFPVSVALGDLNGDGRPDLAVANVNERSVSVHLNTSAPGAGTLSFAARLTLGTGTFPYSVAIGDLNGDGKPDLAVSNSGSDNVAVRLNTTDPGAPTATFAGQQMVATGIAPTSVAIGDLNGDGRPDLAVANYFSNTVSVLLNTTVLSAVAPTFPTAASPATGSLPISVAIGDINRDNLPDLVVANYGSATIAVLLNSTVPGAVAPSFSVLQTFPTGQASAAAALGDLNRDGRPDLAVANSGSGTVSVLLNTTTPGAATATFSAQQSFATGTNPSSVAIGDINVDGVPDLAVANSGSDTVSVLLNTTAFGAATPSFVSQQPFAVGAAPVSVALGDLNGDRRPDLVIANSGSVNVSVRFNVSGSAAPTPSFTALQTIGSGVIPSSVALGDLNGDGKPDLVVADSDSDNVSVLLNSTIPGTGTAIFAVQGTFATGMGPASVAVGDLSGDGRPDLAVANQFSGTVSVLLNTTVLSAVAPTFPTAASPATGIGPISVAIGDLNCDGRPDLAVANYGSDTVSLILNTTAPGAATPTFAAQQAFATESGPSTVVIGDLNGDDRPDLAVANISSDTVSVLLNTTAAGAATPTFAMQQTFATGGFPGSVAVGDLNGDGRPDLAVANSSSATVSVLLNTTAPGAGTPTFAAQQTFGTGPNPSSVAIGDLNGDGRPDLAVANEGSDAASVLINTTAPGAASPTFAAQQTFATGANPSTVAIGDLNGDGRPDLAVANASSFTVSVLLNTTAPGATTPTFAAHQTFATGNSPGSVAIGDLNADGRPDVAVANANSASVSVLLNTTAPGAATPTFAAQQTFAAGAAPRSVALGDLNGDGRLDLAVANQGSQTVSVLLNTPVSISQNTGTGTIAESDPLPTVQFSAATGTQSQTAGAFSVTVTLSAKSGTDTTVPYTVNGTAVAGAHFTGVNVSPLVIAAGQIRGTINGTLLIATPAAGKTLAFTLGTPTNAALGAPAATTLTIVAGPSASITTASGTPQSTLANTAFASTLVATAFDAIGNPAPGANVTLSAPMAGASAVFPNASTTISTDADANGQVSVNLDANGTAGSYAVNAVVLGGLTPATFQLTNISPAIGDFGFTTIKKGIEIDVLANDVPGGTLMAIATQPQHGTATVVGGKINYLPTSPLPIGGDTFTYTCTDAKGSTFTATVTIVNFAAIAGSYDGLIVPDGQTARLIRGISGQESHERSGHLRVTVTKTGSFSGVLHFAGFKLSPVVRAGFRGFGFNSKLGSAGDAIRIVLRRPQGPVTLTLQYDAANHRIEGTAESTDSTAQAFSSSLTLKALTPAHALAGRYTMRIEPDTTPASPQGSGFAAVKISASGLVTVTGKVADGAAFTSASHFHPDQSFPIYASLYGGGAAARGSLRGTVEFPGLPLLIGDERGVLAWFKPLRGNDDFFPAGFALDRTATLGRYQQPVAGQRVLGLDPVAENGRIVLDHGGFAGIDQIFTLPPNNRSTATTPNLAAVSLGFDLRTGLFRGYFMNPTSHRLTPFAGAVFQPDDTGSGYFLGTGPTDGGAAELGKK